MSVRDAVEIVVTDFEAIRRSVTVPYEDVDEQNWRCPVSYINCAFIACTVCVLSGGDCWVTQCCGVSGTSVVQWVSKWISKVLRNNWSQCCGRLQPTHCVLPVISWHVSSLCSCGVFAGLDTQTKTWKSTKQHKSSVRISSSNNSFIAWVQLFIYQRGYPACKIH